MRWVLQNDVFHEPAYQELVAALESAGLPYSIHKVVPIAGELLPEPEKEPKNTICIGMYSMKHAVAKYGWTPGVFDLEPFDFLHQLKHWGSHMLNADARVCRFEDVKFYGDDLKFIRPIADSKVFPGGIYNRQGFEEWHRKVCVLEEDYGDTLTKNTMVQVCGYKIIQAEYRLWVVKGEIVSASLYKKGDRVVYGTEVPEYIFDYGRKRIAEWQPLEAFVIDICLCERGLKIVEINSLNSAGFYACNMFKLVTALENAFNI